MLVCCANNREGFAYLEAHLCYQIVLIAIMLLQPITGLSEPIAIDGLKPYTQNFDSLASSGTSEELPPGWMISETLVNADTFYTAGYGSNNKGDTYSFGAVDDLERALGCLRSHNLDPILGASFKNDTSSVITEIAIQYTGEQWRLGCSAINCPNRGPDRLDFQYSLNASSIRDEAVTWIDVDSLDFISPITVNLGAKDGNAAENRVVIDALISGLSLAPGETIWIRWLDYDIYESDDGLGIDDFSLSIPKPTYTLLSSFSAYVNDANQAVLEWQTSTELGTIGFLLERLNGKAGKYEVVSELLPGTLNPPFGGIYRFVDPEAVPGRQYTYRLVEVTASGEGIVAGPYPITAELPLPTLKMSAVGPKGFMLAQKDFSHQAAARFEKRDQAAAQLVAVQKQKTSRILKLPVRQDGLIYLTAEQLAAASGLKKNQVILLLKSQKILVTLAGKPVPLLATNNGSAFWFYGQAPVRSDIGQNIYRIELGKKGVVMRLAPQPAKKSQVDDPSFAAQVKAEENLRPLHFYNLSKPPQDLWAWDYLFAFGGKPVELARTVLAPHPTGEGPAVLKINLVNTGSNGSGAMAPYKVSVLLNGEEVATGQSKELGDWQLRTEIPAELLREDGSNEVKIISSLNTGIAYSLIHLDSIEVAYQRDHQAEKGELVFSGGLQGRATVKGFKSGVVLALDITDLNRTVRLRPLAVQQGDDGTYAVTVPTQQGHRYFITENLKPQPSALLADTPSKLRDVKNQADWLVIAPAHLLEPAQQLVEHRESQGLVSMAVDIEDVQDEFSWSLPAPEAVHDFLAYVHTKWARAPRYVVLIGDGSIDYQEALGHGLPLVPTELAATPDGLFPSDNALADVVGDDGVPEFALGRIPVFDKAELVHYIDKVITYEQSSRSTTAVLVNDKPDWAAGDFNASADKTVALMPESISAVRIDTGLLGYSAAQAKITAALQQGAGLLHYIGHSSVIRFGNGSGLLSAAGIESMNPIGPPLLMVSMACSSGFFGYPPMNSIGEAALLRADGGAVAFFGATGLSRNYLADILTEGFYRSLADPATERLGDAVVQAKRHYAENQEGAKSHYTLDIYNLLGDPAIVK